MNDDTKREMLKLIEMLPYYDDPAWEDNPDGCMCDIAHAKRKLLEIMQPSDERLIMMALMQREERGK